MLDLWIVEDGATHTVVANDKNEALGLYVTHGGAEEWPSEEPLVKKCERRKEYTLDIGGKKLSLTSGEWCDLMQRPCYLGSSEY